MKKILFIFFVILFNLNNSISFAQDDATSSNWIISPPPSFQLAEPQMLHFDPTVAPNARLYPLSLNQRAPVAGVLLNAEANAWIISQYNFIQSYWITEMNRRVQLVQTWAFAEIEGHNNRANANELSLQVQLTNANETNNDLNRTVQRLLRQNQIEARKRKISLIVLGTGSGLVVAVLSTILLHDAF